MQRSERIIANKFRKLGWCVLRNGAPDFMITNGKIVMAVEVKTGYDKLTSEQKIYRKVLKMAGIEYRVFRVGKDKISQYKSTKLDRYSDRIEKKFHQISAKDKAIILCTIFKIRMRIIKKQIQMLEKSESNKNITGRKAANKIIKNLSKIKVTLSPKECEIFMDLKI